MQRTFGKIGELEPLKGGAWSTAYGFVRGSERLVVRGGEHVDDYERDRLAGTWASESLPIPRVVEIGTDEELNGGVFAVSQRMSGQQSLVSSITFAGPQPLPRSFSQSPRPIVLTSFEHLPVTVMTNATPSTLNRNHGRSVLPLNAGLVTRFRRGRTGLILSGRRLKVFPARPLTQSVRGWRTAKIPRPVSKRPRVPLHSAALASHDAVPFHRRIDAIHPGEP